MSKVASLTAPAPWEGIRRMPRNNIFSLGAKLPLQEVRVFLPATFDLESSKASGVERAGKNTRTSFLTCYTRFLPTWQYGSMNFVFWIYNKNASEAAR